jgi:Icc protein
MKILQITDPHLYGSASARLRGVQTDASLHAVLDDALARVPDYSAMLVTGDLVQDDTAGYLRFRSILGNLSANPCYAYPAITMSRRRCSANSMSRRFASAARTNSANGTSSC